MKTIFLWLSLAVLLSACGQSGPLLLPSGQPPTPGQAASQVNTPADSEDEDEDEKAQSDGR